MFDKVFVDSNILIYLFTSDDNEKKKIAGEVIDYLSEKAVIAVSLQVVNEVCSVLLKKGYTEAEVGLIAGHIMDISDMCPYTESVFHIAADLRSRYSLSYWDSQIIAAAINAECRGLISEDFQDGLKIGSMLIRNVFVRERK